MKNSGAQLGKKSRCRESGFLGPSCLARRPWWCPCFSAVPPSNSLVSVSEYRGPFSADTAPSRALDSPSRRTIAKLECAFVNKAKRSAKQLRSRFINALACYQCFCLFSLLLLLERVKGFEKQNNKKLQCSGELWTENLNIAPKFIENSRILDLPPSFSPLVRGFTFLWFMFYPT